MLEVEKKVLVFIFLLGFLLGVGVVDGTGVLYKRGQLDAINGNIKYCLVKQADNSTQWEKITK